MNIQSPGLECPTCHKLYRRREFYKRHIILCDMLHNGKHSDEDFEDIPNLYELYTMIQELAKKYTECQAECTVLKKKVLALEKSKGNDDSENKMSHEEYLAKYKRCDNSFIEWVDHLQINPSDVKQLLDRNYIEVVCDIIKNNHNFSSPLCCLDNGNKTSIFIYNNKYWEPYTQEHFKKLFNHIQQTILVNSMSYDLDSDSIVHLIDKLTSVDSDKSRSNFNTTLSTTIKQNV